MLQGLYAITPEHPRGDTPLADQVEQAIAGGARVIQYRDKSGDARKRRRDAERLRHICRHHDACFIVNDDVDLAAAVDADGVHVGRDDIALSDAREKLGKGKIIGVSCYNRLEYAEQAQADGADYVAFGRFFPSSSKPLAVQADIELLRLARRGIDLPIVAIGGITPENGEPLIEAGADMLAVIDAVFGQHDIKNAAGRFSRLFR